MRGNIRYEIITAQAITRAESKQSGNFIRKSIIKKWSLKNKQFRN